MNLIVFFTLIAGVFAQVTFPEATTSTRSSTIKSTASSIASSRFTTTTTGSTFPSRSSTIRSTVSSIGSSRFTTTTGSSIPSRSTSRSTLASTVTTTTEDTTTEDPSDLEFKNNCLCVPTNSCDIVLGGNETEPEFDGAGIIQARIINTVSEAFKSYGTNGSVTSPIATGTSLKTVSPTFCVKSNLLELCCPKTGYQCGVPLPALPTKSKASNGTAEYGQFPWSAIIFTLRQFYVGGGALIDQYHVISVAHRFDRFDSDTAYKVRLGDYDTATMSEPLPYQEFNVSEMIVHPRYNKKNLQFNLIILRLIKPVPFGRFPTIAPACLPSKPILPPTRCWVSGYGQDDFLQGTNQAIMKAVDVELVESSKCEASLKNTKLRKNFRLNTETFMCAGGEKGKDACTGDGGAPLVCKDGNQWYLQGLVCWGISCGEDIPSVYVNVSNFIPWIINVTKI